MPTQPPSPRTVRGRRRCSPAWVIEVLTGQEHFDRSVVVRCCRPRIRDDRRARRLALRERHGRPVLRSNSVQYVQYTASVRRCSARVPDRGCVGCTTVTDYSALEAMAATQFCGVASFWVDSLPARQILKGSLQAMYRPARSFPRQIPVSNTG